MQVIPTVNKKEFLGVEERIRLLVGTTRWVQVDVADGILTPGKSFELELLTKVEEELLWDIHLRVKEPINWVKKCIFVGASRVIGQVEMMVDRENFVKRVQDEGMEVGLGFDIETQVDNIPKDTDIVLLMARKAGFEEKPFEEKVLEKIRKVKEMGFTIGVDGGIGLDNFEKLKSLGVDVIYSESNYFDLINANK